MRRRNGATTPLVTGAGLFSVLALLCGCAAIDDGADRPGTAVGQRPAAVAAKPNHRQYFDQRRGRYYYFDQTDHRYYWEDGAPRD
jgi:hypothetical protein